MAVPRVAPTHKLVALVLCLALVPHLAWAIQVLNMGPSTSFTADLAALLVSPIADDYEIVLSPGNYNGCGPGTIELDAGLAISVTVKGAGMDETVIDCQGQSLNASLFTCSGLCVAAIQDVTATNLTMRPATGPDNVGALLSVQQGASATVDGVRVTSCSIVTNGETLDSSLIAASSVIRVANVGSTLSVTDSVFLDNVAEIGVISTQIYGYSSVLGSNFTGNFGGGGLPMHGLGGALSFADYGEGDVAWSTFTSNSAASAGGAIYAHSHCQVSLSNVVVRYSSAESGGMMSLGLSSDATFRNVTAHAQTSIYGGMAYVFYASLQMYNTSVSSSSALGSGAVLQQVYRGFVTWEGGSSTDSSCGSYAGWAILLNESELVVRNVTVEGSRSSGYGGLVYAEFLCHASFEDVVVRESSAAVHGGIFRLLRDSALTVTNATFQSSYAGNCGGVVYASEGGSVRFERVNVTASEAFVKGAVVFVALDGVNVVFDEVVVSNSTCQSGCIVYAEGLSNVSLVNVLVSVVTSTLPGGVVVADSSASIHCDNVTLSNLKTATDALIYGSNSTMNLSSIVVDGDFDRPYLYLFVSSQVTVANCQFESSLANAFVAVEQPSTFVTLVRCSLFLVDDGALGVLATNGALVSLVDSHVSVVPSSATGVQADSSTVLVTNSTFVLERGPALGVTGSLVHMTGSQVKTTDSDGAAAIVSIFSSVTIVESSLESNTVPIVSLLGEFSLESARVTSTIGPPFYAAGTSWTISHSIMSGIATTVFGGTASVSTSFVAVSSPRSPALACTTAVTLSNSVTCGSGGADPSPAGTCAGPSTALGATQSNCHDACFSSSFCVPDVGGGSEGGGSGSGNWIDTLGCPLCGGQCWLGTANCNVTTAYCFDVQGGGFMCECRTGYLGDGVVCQDINECELDQSLCDAPFTRCENTPGSFSCVCEPGSTDVNGLCQDVDECQVGENDCVMAAACVNTVGSFFCQCDPNTYGNGTSECTPCPPSSSTVGGGATDVSACKCLPGLYMGPSTCLACPSNTYSREGSVQVTECFCEPFFFRLSGQPQDAPCELCPPGRFAPNGGQCLPCPVDTYSALANSSACTDCPEGSGTSLQVGLDTCTCVTNFNSSGSGDTLVCTQSCPPGWQIEGSTCQLCGFGKYSTTVNSLECTECATGSTTGRANATSSEECECLPDRLSTGDGSCPLDCPPGFYYLSGASECTACGRDTYWALNSETGLGSCLPCPPHSYTVGVGAANVSECLCSDGFGFDDVRGWCAVQCEPGFSLKASSCELCGQGSYSSVSNSITCTECPANALSPPGAVSPSNCSCVAGFYLEASTGECPSCPEGAVCGGGQVSPVAEPGYYEVERGHFVACVPASACASDNECEVGYEGRLCAACSVGFFRLDGYCRPCSRELSFLAGAALLLFLAGAASLIVFNLREERASDQVRASFGGLFIAFNSFQIIAMFGKLEIAWPPIIRQVLAGLSLLFNFNVEVVGIECFASGGDGGSSRSGDGGVTHPFFVSWLVAILLPFYVAGSLLLMAVFMVFLHTCTPCAPTVRGYQGAVLRKHVMRAAFVSFLQATLLLYFPLAVSVFETFQCVDDGTGLQVLASSRDMACSGAGYAALFWAGVAATLTYIAGIPLALIGWLLWLRTHGSEADLYDKAEVVVGKYRKEVYGYECVVLLRKAGVAAILLLLTPSPYLRAAGGAAVLLSFFVVNRLVTPFRLRWHNWIECSSLLTTVVVLEIGVAMQGTQWSETAKVVVAGGGLALALVVVVAAACYEVWRAMRLWRGLATDEISIRVYGYEADLHKHNLSSEYMDDRSSVGHGEGVEFVHHTLQTLSHMDLDSLATIAPPPPPPMFVPPGRVNSLTTQMSVDELSNLATVVPPPPPSPAHPLALPLPPPPPPPPLSSPQPNMGGYNYSTDHSLHTAMSLEDLDSLATVAPPPPSSPPPRPTRPPRL